MCDQWMTSTSEQPPHEDLISYLFSSTTITSEIKEHHLPGNVLVYRDVTQANTGHIVSREHSEERLPFIRTSTCGSADSLLQCFPVQTPYHPTRGEIFGGRHQLHVLGLTFWEPFNLARRWLLQNLDR